MASTNKTANLDLSQFIGSDKPDWLTDYNGDMLKIDNSIGDVSASAEVAARNAQIAADNAASAITKADAAVEQIGGIVDTVTRAEEVADRAESVANNALTVANNTASLASDAVGLANDALAKAASAKTQAESAVASAGEAVTTANAAKTVADAAADDVAGAVDAANAATAAVNAMDGRIGDIEDVIPDNVSASNKLVTAADIPGGVSVDSALNAASNNPVTNAAITTAINAEHTRVDEIEALIPSSASASNQLATMADVGGGSKVVYRMAGVGSQVVSDVITALWNNAREHLTPGAMIEFGSSVEGEGFRLVVDSRAVLASQGPLNASNYAHGICAGTIVIANLANGYCFSATIPNNGTGQLVGNIFTSRTMLEAFGATTVRIYGR